MALNAAGIEVIFGRSCFRMPDIGQLIETVDRTAGPMVACALEIGLCHRVRMLTNAIWPSGLYLGCSNCSLENTGLYLVAHARNPIDVEDEAFEGRLSNLVKYFKTKKEKKRMEMLSGKEKNPY